MNISGERLELDPLISGAAKPVFVQMEYVIGAEIVAEKAKGTATFRLVNLGVEEGLKMVTSDGAVAFIK